jgi:dTDP-4-dehydrorhamnose reductase
MAELESIKAHSINAQGPRNLAQCAKQYGAKLIHISTDFVFDGNKNSPYLISDKTEPKSEYGLSKVLGEKFLYRYDNAITIRVSWLYSEYCKNFFKTMYQRIKNHEKTYVVNDQIGTPTYARDLANFIIYLIENNKLEETKNKVYHFSNEGCCSWYDFAKAIEIEFNRLDGGESLEHQVINPISTYGYQTMIGKPMAIRPSYSILSHMGIEQIYDKPIRHWLEALNECYIRNRNIE